MRAGNERKALHKQEANKDKDNIRREDINSNKRKKRKLDDSEQDKEKMLNLLHSMQVGPIDPNTLELKIIPDYHARITRTSGHHHPNPLDCFFRCMPLDTMQNLVDKIDTDHPTYWYKEMRRHLKKYFTIQVL